MLAESISCDDGIQFDVTCDRCDDVMAGPFYQRHDRGKLWELARRRGWVSGQGNGGDEYRCPDCAATGRTAHPDRR